MPSAVRRELGGRLAPYRARHQAARWTRPETWHLTLLFLGSVRARRIDELVELAEAIAQAADAPYPVRASRGGGRVARGDGVAWLGLSEGSARLLALAAQAAQRCPADITTGAPPKPTPGAHLTLARRADAAVIRDLRAQALGSLDVAWQVDRLQLVRSHLSRDGARYETVHESAL